MNYNKAEFDETLRMLGVRGVPDPELAALTGDVLEECHRLAKVRYIYGFFDLEPTPDRLLLKGCKLTLDGKDICAHLKGCQSCALMAVTVGAAVDTAIARYQKSDMTRAVILDAAAGVVADAAADLCEEEIRKVVAAQNLTLTTRFSPGYGDFPIECQRLFLDTLSCGTRLGLTVTQSSMLLPTKSITAILGTLRCGKCLPNR